MKVALIASYDKLIQGLTKASDPILQEKLRVFGWDQLEYEALKQSLAEVQAAEHALFASSHALSERISEAQEWLLKLDTVLKMAGAGSLSPATESSFRYSTSLSSSSSLPWKYNSGTVWVTTTSSGPESGTIPGALRSGTAPTKNRKKPAAKKIPAKKTATKKTPAKKGKSK